MNNEDQRSRIMKKALFIVFYVLYALMFSGQVVGAENMDPCLKIEDDYEEAKCRSPELRKADAELNSLYKKLMSLLSKEQERKDELRAAQNAWIKYRDAHCEFHARAWEYYVDGFITESWNECFYELTKNRIKELQLEIKMVNYPLYPAYKKKK